LKMELTQGSETSANYNLTPGQYPKEYIQNIKLYCFYLPLRAYFPCMCPTRLTRFTLFNQTKLFLRLHKNGRQRCTNSGCQVAQETKFCTSFQDTCGSSA